MSSGLLVTSHSSLFSFSQRFLFDVPYHLSFPRNLSQPIACLVTISYNKEKRTEVRKRR